MVKKKVGLVLLVVMILSLGVTSAYARYSYTDQLDVDFSISGSIASCSGKVHPSESGHTASVTVKLQGKVNSTWNTVTSWSATASKAGSSAATGGTYTLTRGYEYRVYVAGTVKDSSGTVLENTSITSATKTY